MNIIFHGQSLTVRVHPDNQELFSLNDLHKASGLTGQLGDLVKNLSEKQLRRYGVLKVNGGLNRGTYANEKGAYWFAAKVDEDFEDAVFNAFHAVANGDTAKAVDVVASVVPDELIRRAHDASKQLNYLIPLWDQKQDKQRGSRAHIIIWDYIVCKTTTGGTLKSIKDAHGVSSLADYFEKSKNKEGLGAYLALANMLIPLLENGIDYYLLKKIFTENHLKSVI